MIATANRLRRHGDFQQVYKGSRKRFSKQMSYFFLLRHSQSPNQSSSSADPITGPRVGLTVSRAMGNAVHRNRIKRRMREAIRRHIATLRAPVDVVLHPQRRVVETEFSILERDVAQVFQDIQQALDRQLGGKRTGAAEKRP
jgi:ribonuclease P protein component